jgi:hypothetical protein
MGKRYVVTMTKAERGTLEELIVTGKAAARKFTTPPSPWFVTSSTPTALMLFMKPLFRRKQHVS